MCVSRMLLACAWAAALPTVGVERATGQELPGGLVEALITYFADEYATDEAPLVVEVDGFPSPSVALNVARATGLVAGFNSDLVVCTADRRVCRLSSGRRLVRFMGHLVEEPGKKVLVQVILSVQWESPDGQAARLLPTLREVVLENSGGWRVTRDRSTIRGD